MTVEPTPVEQPKRKRAAPTGAPKGWRVLHADVCWEDHGGLWCKRDKHSASKRAYDLCKFERCEWDPEDTDEHPRYECGTSYINLDDEDADKITSALKSCGWHALYNSAGLPITIVNTYDGEIIANEPRTVDFVILDALAGYGIDWDYEYQTGGRPSWLRASCVRGL